MLSVCGAGACRMQRLTIPGLAPTPNDANANDGVARAQSREPVGTYECCSVSVAPHGMSISCASTVCSMARMAGKKEEARLDPRRRCTPKRVAHACTHPTSLLPPSILRRRSRRTETGPPQSPPAQTGKPPLPLRPFKRRGRGPSPFRISHARNAALRGIGPRWRPHPTWVPRLRCHSAPERPGGKTTAAATAGGRLDETTRLAAVEAPNLRRSLFLRAGGWPGWPGFGGALEGPFAASPPSPRVASSLGPSWKANRGLAGTRSGLACIGLLSPERLLAATSCAKLSTPSARYCREGRGGARGKKSRTTFE